jgi:hypothetical protein
MIKRKKIFTENFKIRAKLTLLSPSTVGKMVLEQSGNSGNIIMFQHKMPETEFDTFIKTLVEDSEQYTEKEVILNINRFVGPRSDIRSRDVFMTRIIQAISMMRVTVTELNEYFKTLELDTHIKLIRDMAISQLNTNNNFYGTSTYKHILDAYTTTNQHIIISAQQESGGYHHINDQLLSKVETVDTLAERINKEIKLPFDKFTITKKTKGSEGVQLLRDGQYVDCIHRAYLKLNDNNVVFICFVMMDIILPQTHGYITRIDTIGVMYNSVHKSFNLIEFGGSKTSPILITDTGIIQEKLVIMYLVNLIDSNVIEKADVDKIGTLKKLSRAERRAVSRTENRAPYTILNLTGVGASKEFKKRHKSCINHDRFSYSFDVRRHERSYYNEDGTIKTTIVIEPYTKCKDKPAKEIYIKKLRKNN